MTLEAARGEYGAEGGRAARDANGAWVPLCRGRHRFTDPPLARIAGDRGLAAAWIEGFHRHGCEVVHRVEGDFAVALTDAQGRRFLAVDRFAIHSLCYAMRDGALAFAERADELAQDRAAIDRQAVVDYLYFHMIPAPRTIWRGVSRLPAGHYALADGDGVKVARWWNPKFIENAAAPLGMLAAEFRDALRSAVAKQIDGDKTGCFLSGGTDSSSVAGLVGEITGKPARTYSIGFSASGYDEMEYARIAAHHFHCDHHELYVTPHDVVDAIPRVAAHYDQPFGNSSVVPAYYCAKLARDTGVDVMLAGDGGDELFGGNSRYARQRVFDAYRHLPTALRERVLEPALLGMPRMRRLPGVKKAASYVEQARVPMPDRMQMGNLALHIGFAELLAPEFLAGLDTAEPGRLQRAVYGEVPSGSLINRMLAYDWRFTLADNDLPKVVGATAVAGTDVRFPFLDDRVVDLSLRLPPDYKLRGLALRWFFKQASRGFLPDAILRKKKHGFGLPFGLWLIGHAPLQELAFESVRALGRRGIVRPEFVERLLGRHVHEHPAYYGELVFIFTMLEQWLAAQRPPTVS
jgi:asparagine synthase (glutamine-hydrolysing)